MKVMENQQAPLMLQNPYIAKIIGGRYYKKLAESMQQLNQQQAQQQAMLKGGGEPTPPPGIDSINPTQLGAMGG
jgi:hypothetical protein